MKSHVFAGLIRVLLHPPVANGLIKMAQLTPSGTTTLHHGSSLRQL